MDPATLQRYAQLKAQRTQEKAAASGVPGGVLGFLSDVTAPPPKYNPERDSPEYRARVDEIAKRRAGTVGFRTQAVNAATFGFAQKAANALASLPALLDEREFFETYDANLDADRIAQGDYMEENPAGAITAEIAGALYGGSALAKVGGAAIRGTGNALGFGRAADAVTRYGATNAARFGQNVAIGAGSGALYAAGNDLDIQGNAILGGALGPVGAAGIRAIGGAVRTAPVLTAGAAAAGAANLAGADKETQAALAVGAGALASRAGRSAAARLLSAYGRKPGQQPAAARDAVRQQDATTPRDPKIRFQDGDDNALTPDDLTAGRRTLSAMGRDSNAREGARAVVAEAQTAGGQDAARGVVAAIKRATEQGKWGYAQASKIIKAVGGPRQALEKIGELSATTRRLRTAVDQHRAQISKLRDEARLASQNYSESQSAVAALRAQNAQLNEEARLAAQRYNEAENARAGLALALNELRGTFDDALRGASVSPRGTSPLLGSDDAARVAAAAEVKMAQAFDQEVSSIEEEILSLQNLNGLRDKISDAVEKEIQNPGEVRRLDRAAYSYYSVKRGGLGMVERSPSWGLRAKRARKELAPEREIEELTEQRAVEAEKMFARARKLLTQVDPKAPNAAELRARLVYVESEARRMIAAKYRGADGTSRGEALRFQDADTATPPGGRTASQDQITRQMRQTLDDLGLEDVDVELVTADVMESLGEGASRTTRAATTPDGTRILINIDAFTEDSLTHEVLHAFRGKGLIRDAEFKPLLNAARRKIGAGGIRDLRSRPAYANLSDDAFDEELVARYVGPALAAVVSGKKVGTRLVDKIATRIVSVGRGLRSAITGADLDPDEVIQRMASGQLGSRSRVTPSSSLVGIDRMNRGYAGFAAYASPRTVEESARASAANEFGVRLSRGQQSGNIAQLGREDAYAAGTNGPAAQEIMERFFERQRGQVETAVENVADSLGVGGPGPLSPLDTMVEVVEGVARRDDARRIWSSRKYDMLAKAAVGVEFSQPQTLVASLRATLDDLVSPGSKASGVLTRVERELDRKGGKMSLLEFRQLRGKILEASRSTQRGTTDALEMQRMTRAMDDWFDSAVDSDGAFRTTGAPDKLKKAIARLRDANKYYRKYKEAFDLPQNATSTQKRAMNIISAMADREIGPNELVRDIFGSGQVGGTELSVRLLSQLERILNYRATEVKRAGFFTDDYMTRMAGQAKPTTVSSSGPKIPSPEWQAIRAAAFRQLTEAPAGKADFGYRQMANRIDGFLNGSGKGAANVLFEPEEREMLKRFAQTMRVLDRKSERFNPSGSGYTKYRVAYDYAQKIFGGAVGYSIGESLIPGGGGMLGAAAGFGTGSPVGRAISNLRGQAAARGATGPQAAPMSPVVEGVINWAKFRTAIAAASSGGRIPAETR